MLGRVNAYMITCRIKSSWPKKFVKWIDFSRKNLAGLSLANYRRFNFPAAKHSRYAVKFN